MKKIVMTIAAMLLITSLTACSGSSGDSDSTSVASTTEASTSKQTEKTVAAESTKVPEPKNNEELSLAIKFPLIQKFVDGPRWQIIDKGYTSLYNINDRKFLH